jgi:transposase
MDVYGGIDLHSNNSLVAVIDAQGKPLYRRRIENDLTKIELALRPYREQLKGIAVESTFNWCWLVDGLMASGYPVRLTNTSAIEQYSGLKHTDDDSDALWLAGSPAASWSDLRRSARASRGARETHCVPGPRSRRESRCRLFLVRQARHVQLLSLRPPWCDCHGAAP